MLRLNHRFIRIALSAALTTIVAFGTALPASADDGSGGGNTDLTLTGGSLHFTAAPTVDDLAGITLDGTKKTTTAALSTFSVADATGSGDGWHVTVQATQLKEWDGSAYVTSGRALPLGSLKLSKPTVAQATDTTSPVPSINAGPTYTVDAVSAVSIASAVVDEGMGTYNFSATTLTLTVNPEAYAADYRSAITVSVISAP